MPRLNKLFIQQADIFLAPGGYFHYEYSTPLYHQLPMVLQRQHNQQLIQQYQLALPDENTPLLPKVLADHWHLLPRVALGLGVISSPEPLPWWGQLPQYHALRKQLKYSFHHRSLETPLTPQRLLAQGAAQLLACLVPFGEKYTSRAKYMFSHTTLQVIPTSHNVILPWNIIEETCHYVRTHTL